MRQYLTCVNRGLDGAVPELNAAQLLSIIALITPPACWQRGSIPWPTRPVNDITARNADQNSSWTKGGEGTVICCSEPMQQK